ncbi:MAG TPA: hypothetical protein VMM55_03185, partial [Thermohalobaculum sp.]|nr:hypothetical protein [Thermohalobaculum sp.]
MTHPNDPRLREPPSPTEVAYQLAVARQLRASHVAEQLGHISRVAVARIRRLGRAIMPHRETDTHAL